MCVLGLLAGTSANGALEEVMPAVWTLSEQRTDAAVVWMTSIHGSPLDSPFYPTVGNLSSGKWNLAFNNRDWRSGFWPGILWILSQRTGDATWRARAEEWSAPLFSSSNIDHDIGFIALASAGKGRLFHDDSSDPAGLYRASAGQAIQDAAAKLDSRFNKPVVPGVPIPSGFTRSWNSPFQDPYPVCVDNLMNLEVLFLAYEINGRQPASRHWFDHALTHARTSIAKHLRQDGSTYHVIKHFESGPAIGQVERKNTAQGYGGETTWSRGQAWAIYGFTAVYRHAGLDPGTDASDILAAAQATADYFISRLPANFTADAFNHRPGDFVPPSDFDAALGEPAGPWNDANGNYNSSTGSGLGDRKPPTASFTARDTSAAAIAASGLIELSGHALLQADKDRYLKAAEDILYCLITYDGPDPGNEPDYLCQAGDTSYPGILKAGSVRWGDPNLSLIYGDYYFLEALARMDALYARKALEDTRQAFHDGVALKFRFEMPDPAPALAIRIEKSEDLTEGNWVGVAQKTGAASWTGSASMAVESLTGNRSRFTMEEPAAGARGFIRIHTRSIGGLD